MCEIISSEAGGCVQEPREKCFQSHILSSNFFVPQIPLESQENTLPSHPDCLALDSAGTMTFGIYRSWKDHGQVLHQLPST